MTTFEKWNWTTILAIVVAVELQIGGGQMSLAHMIPADWIDTVKAWSANLGTVGALIMAQQSFGMKRVPGDSVAIRALDRSTLDGIKTGDHINVGVGSVADAAKIVGAILIAFTIMAMAWTQPAFAQTRPLTGNIVKDFAPRATSAPSTADDQVASLSSSIQKIEKAVVDKGIADLQSAITDATNHSDQISLPCWQANLKLLQSLPSQWETPPSPIGIALGIQIQRDLLNAITGSDAGSIKVACAALWGDQLKIIANVGALIGVRIATGGLF